MSYSRELEEKYKKDYQDFESLSVWSNNRTAERMMFNFDTDNNLQIFHNSGFLEDEVTFWEFEEDSKSKINEEATLAYCGLNSERVYPFFGLQNQIKYNDYSPDDPLPSSFYFALKHKAIKKITGRKKSKYTDLNYDMKTFGDLPQEFIEGIKSGSIVIDPVEDDELKKEGFSNNIASICKALPKRPLTILIYGQHPKHIASYIARISEDNRCELLSLNSLPGYKDSFFIEALKEGVKKGLELSDEDFEDPIYKIIHQRDASTCAIITPAVLSQVDPQRTLSEQVVDLENVMKGVRSNKKMIRRLFARIEWWNQEVNSRKVKDEHGQWHYIERDTEALEQAMHEVFKQLFYHVCGLPAPSKNNLNEDPEIFKESAKFLKLFNIDINDQAFLKLFNRVEQKTLEVDSNESEIDEEVVGKYFDRNNWIKNKGQLVNKLASNEEISDDLKAGLEHALDNLAIHARLNLDSKFSTKRALAGQDKYQALSTLFQESENLEDLQKNIKKFLDVKNPDKSVLLKNRGGFFGAYKTFSRFASHLGAKHYKLGERTAISRTDHYLIALSDAIDKVNQAKADHQSDLSQN